MEDEGFVKRGRVRLTDLGEEVEVDLYDLAQHKRVKVGCLLFLPASLQTSSFPAASVRLTVTGLAPLYRDPHWSQDCRRVVTNHLEGTLGRGRVLSETSEVVWLERCQFIKYSRDLNTWIIIFQVQSSLVSLSWAEAQDEFKTHLVQLMDESHKEAGVEGTKTKTKIEAEENKTKKETEVEGTKPKKKV